MQTTFFKELLKIMILRVGRLCIEGRYKPIGQ